MAAAVTQWLQTVCDRYAEAKYATLRDDKDVSFLYCGSCDAAVNAFAEDTQFACMVCARFLCTACKRCRCAGEPVLVSDGDNRVGRLTEYCARARIHRCAECSAFFFTRVEYLSHRAMHHLADPVAAHLTFVLLRNHTTVVAGVGRMRYDGRCIRAVFAPYPRRLSVGNTCIKGFETIVKTPQHSDTVTVTVDTVFVTPVLCNPVGRCCHMAVAHYTKTDTLVPRPVCFTGSRGVAVIELVRWLQVVAERYDGLMNYLVYYVPGNKQPQTDGFCIMLVDTPWTDVPAVVCPGCCDWFPWRATENAFSAHIHIDVNYIKAVAVRVHSNTGQYFQPTSRCAAYAHACDLNLETKAAAVRAQHSVFPGRMRVHAQGCASTCVYGCMLQPTVSRSRFIGVVITTAAVECAVCGDTLTMRRGHTSTSMLHFIATHFMIGPEVVTTMRELQWIDSCYEICGNSITEIM